MNQPIFLRAKKNNQIYYNNTMLSAICKPSANERSDESSVALTISEDGRLVLIKQEEINPNKQTVFSYVEKDHLTRTYTCIAFSKTDGSVGGGKRKKNAAAPAEAEEAGLLIATGCRDGSIQVFSANNELKLLYRISHSTVSAVKCLSFKTKTSIYVSYEGEGNVYELNVKNGEEVSKKIEVEDKTLNCLAVNSDCTLLAVGRNSIKVFQNGEKIVKYQGHASGTFHLDFVSKNNLLVSSGEDRFINVWPSPVNAGSRKIKQPLLVLSCNNPSVSLSSFDSSVKKECFSICSLSNEDVSVWAVPHAIADQSQIAPSSLSPFTSFKLPASAIQFANAQNVVMLLKDRKLHRRSLLLGEESEPKHPAAVVVKEDAENKKRDRMEIIDSAIALKRARSLSTSSKASNGAEDAIDLPMAQRLASLTSRLKEKKLSSAAVSSSAASSLTAALEQAVKAGDKDKLESVLQCNNLDVIKNTVR